MTAIRVPVPPQGHGFAYEKLKRKVGDYATAATAVILVMDGGKCDTASVALTNLGETAIYAEEASASLVGSAIDDAAIEKAAEIVKGTIEPFSDLKGTVEYRTAMAGVMTSRAIRLAAERGS